MPLLSIITQLSSRSKHKRTGITACNEEGGFVVKHSKIGVLRSAVVAVLLLGFFFWGSLGSVLDDSSDSKESRVCRRKKV